MTAMGNRFGVQGLGAEAVHSIRDVSEARISEENRPTAVSCHPEVPKTLNERKRSEAVNPEFGARYNNYRLVLSE